MAGPRLLERVRAAIRARHYSYRTEQAYVHWIRRFIRFHGRRHPTEMGKREVETFLTDLAVRRNVSAVRRGSSPSCPRTRCGHPYRAGAARAQQLADDDDLHARTAAWKARRAQPGRRRRMKLVREEETLARARAGGRRCGAASGGPCGRARRASGARREPPARGRNRLAAVPARPPPRRLRRIPGTKLLRSGGSCNPRARHQRERPSPRQHTSVGYVLPRFCGIATSGSA